MSAQREPLTYRELEDHLTAGMAQRNRPAVKTYLVEPVQAERHRDVPEFLRRSLRAASPRRRVEVAPLRDSSTVFEARVGPVTLWIDTGEGRFWEVHSLDETTVVSAIVDRWIAQSPGLDVPWFPEQLLRVAAGSGEFIGFGLSYSRAFFAEDPEEAESLSVRVSGSESRDALTSLQQQRTFLRASALSMVRVRNPLSGPGATEVGHITASLTARGRVSSRGDNFGRHRAFFRYSADLYRRAEAKVRETMPVGEFDSAGRGLRGALVIKLVTEIDDLGAFCGRVFSGGDPFRLWGLLERHSEDLIVANAFDQRAGSAFTVEATPREWRLFLPANATGAIPLRLLTLLQQNHDRRASIEGLLPV